MKINVKHPLFILAAGLVLVGAGAFGTTRAVEEYSSGTQGVQFETAKFSVDLIEEQSSGEITVAGSHTKPATLALSAFDKVKAGTEEIKVDYPYPEKVWIQNNSGGEFPEYVRVVVDKNWVDENGDKDTSADPALIGLNAASGWSKIDSGKEQTVFYYTKPIEKSEKIQLLESIQLDKKVIDGYSKTEIIDGNKYVTIEGYESKTFSIQMRVDAVQAHHAEDAMLGAWGVVAEINEDGTIKSIDGTDL